MLPLQWTREWWQWKGTLQSPKFQHYWNFTIRLFSVISRTLVLWERWSLPPTAEKQSVYSTAHANWAKPAMQIWLYRMRTYHANMNMHHANMNTHAHVSCKYDHIKHTQTWPHTDTHTNICYANITTQTHTQTCAMQIWPHKDPHKHVLCKYDHTEDKQKKYKGQYWQDHSWTSSCTSRIHQLHFRPITTNTDHCWPQPT